MTSSAKPRAIGLNHIALEVGDIEEALAFYGRLFEFELRGKSESMAFIDLGDQFIALQRGRKQPSDDGRHFGLVVDDKEAARCALQAAGIEQIAGPFLDFLDPWGNRIEIVDYATVQFTKAPNVLHGMGLDHLSKSESAVVASAVALCAMADKPLHRKTWQAMPAHSKTWRRFESRPEGPRVAERRINTPIAPAHSTSTALILVTSATASGGTSSLQRSARSLATMANPCG